MIAWFKSTIEQLISSWVFLLIVFLSVGLSAVCCYLVLVKGASAKDEINSLIGAYSTIMTQLNAMHLINSGLNTVIGGNTPK